MPETPIEHWDYTRREWDTSEFKRIMDALPENIKVIYDIGANVGGWSSRALEKYPKAKIHAFEPVLSNFTALKEFLPNITAHNFGIFYGATESRALWRGSNIGAIFVEQINAGEPRVQRDGETIQLKTLEELKIPKPDLIKMDIEGAEENVLEHSKICKKAPYIILEWHPSTDPFEFFEKHLPRHKILVNLQNSQFLLELA